ncbi:polynucleotide 3'-phosphatase ZDP isoform X1 [Ipomoea triloba]|uniref:polynucleotide 3'-phosphatase ZDP isoform X1 n=1 Tax=Ipomoea triloba TaxID=35885 RepID=UPI00125D45ED|nr:polynucleotide 3'-phosphatase ZDP isoform X1 [Ipomoea triloba]
MLRTLTISSCSPIGLNPSLLPLILSFSSSSMATPAKVVAEYAKSSKSSCKKCSKAIAASSLRLGLVSKAPQGFSMTKWHHMECFPLSSDLIPSANAISGFSSLKSSDQEDLAKFISEATVDEQEVSDKDESAKNESRKRMIIEGLKKSPDLHSPNFIPIEVQETDGKEGTELEEDRIKIAKTSASIKGPEVEIAFSIVDVKSHYKDAKLLPKWKAFQTTIYLEQDEGILDSEKIAAFDFDGCLAKTSVKRIGANAWSLMYPSIPEKLQSLYNDGYKLVIFTNESNIERWKNKRQTAVDSKIGRLEGFIKLVKVPIQVFIACGSSNEPADPFRKPKIGMWNLLKNHFNSGLPIDMDKSFYVGDAAGRKDDHSDADIKFAEAIGLKFYLPEDFFST